MASRAIRTAVANALRGDHRQLSWGEISAARRLYWLGLADICLTAIETYNRETPMAQKLIDRLQDIGAHAWLTFVQSLNAIVMALLGGAVVVHQAYPQIIAGAVSKLPPAIGIPLIFAFGIIVHFALRSAKRA